MGKAPVDVFEFRGGYAVVPEGELYALLEGYRAGTVKKCEFRVWAATHEERMLHVKSRVTINRILNAKASEARIKRMRSAEISQALERVTEMVRSGQTGRKRIVARVILRAIAQGRFSCTECVASIMYFLRRISQRKELRRLLPSERYARFTLRELEELSGVSRANLSRTIASLKAKGFLSTVWVVKQNENQFGLLFVDGHLLSLIPGAAADRAAKEKKATPSAQKNNAPVIILPTLKKDDPKKEIQKEERALWTGGKTWKCDWDRIRARGAAMKEGFTDEAA